MNGTTTRCISLAQGNHDPLERVNYSFGLVLGVDEFVDEQVYFLEKEYLHNRALHGYGTVSGLQVSREQNGQDIEIRVEPGIGIDQYGRVFIVRNTQCASLLSWLDDQELAPGDQTIFVVARYAECETELVPIAGEPCSSSELLNAPSRIRDIFEIELVLEPPPQPAYTATRNLAEFLSRFRIDPDAGELPDLGTPARLASIIGQPFIAESPAGFRQRLNTIIEELTGTGGARLIPVRPAAALALRDAIYAYWVTEVRPTLSPDLVDPDRPENSDAEPPPADLLLAQINFPLPEEGDPELEEIAVDNTVRPVLLHTALIQELFRFPDEAGEGEAAPARPAMAFASVEDAGERLLTLWLHIGADLALQAGENVRLIRIEDDGTPDSLTFELREDTARRNDVGRYYRLRTFVNLNNGDFLLLQFDTENIEVTTAGGETQTLTGYMETLPVAYANFNPGTNRLLAFHVVDRGETIDEERIRQIIEELMPPPEPPQPAIPFVTITPITASEGDFDFLRSFELWFHLDGLLEQNDGGIENLHMENLHLWIEIAPGAVQPVPFEMQMVRPNLWYAHPQIENPELGLPLARFAFMLDADYNIKAFNPQAGGLDGFPTLREYIDGTRQQLDGHLLQSEQLGDVLVVYVRQQGRARRIQE